MKKFIAPLFIVSMLSSGTLMIGCSEPVAHSEKDSPTLLGGTKHEESTTYRNADGTTTTTHQESKSNP